MTRKRPALSMGKKRKRKKLSPVALADKVRRVMAQRHQLAETTRPKQEPPELPRYISKLENRQIAQLYNQFVQWANYVDEMLTMYDIEELELSDNLDFSEARERLRLGNEGTKQYREDAVLVDHITAHQKSTEKKAAVKFLKARLRSCERAIKFLSREQTRRADEASRE